MTENAMRVYYASNEHQMYFGNVRIYDWHVGAAAVIIGALGLLFDDNRKRKNVYDTLVARGAVTILNDLPNFIKSINDLLK